MKAVFIFPLIIILILHVTPALATQEAILAADSMVSKYRSSLEQYHVNRSNHRNAAARQLITSEKVFVCPRDTRVEIVRLEKNIARIRLWRLDSKANVVGLYFWTLPSRLKSLPQ